MCLLYQHCNYTRVYVSIAYERSQVRLNKLRGTSEVKVKSCERVPSTLPGISPTTTLMSDKPAAPAADHTNGSGTAGGAPKKAAPTQNPALKMMGKFSEQKQA